MLFFVGSFSDGGIFSFRERIGRKKYLIRLLITIGLSFVAVGFIYFAAKFNSMFILIPGIVLILGTLFYSITNEIKRLHDMNQSGWWVLVLYVITFLAKQSPETDLIFTLGIHIALASIKGTSGQNKYGADPLVSKQMLSEVTP